VVLNWIKISSTSQAGRRKMLNEVIVIYAIVDDLLKAVGHQEDRRSQMSDSEVMTANQVRRLSRIYSIKEKILLWG
jgi:hypothetical protein